MHFELFETSCCVCVKTSQINRFRVDSSSFVFVLVFASAAHRVSVRQHWRGNPFSATVHRCYVGKHEDTGRLAHSFLADAFHLILTDSLRVFFRLIPRFWKLYADDGLLGIFLLFWISAGTSIKLLRCEWRRHRRCANGKMTEKW